MMSLWDALRMNMMISYQELVRTFHKDETTPFYFLTFVFIFKCKCEYEYNVKIVIKFNSDVLVV
ncbi:hypothetical protein KPC94_01477 [Klebsiella pneumoniae]|nr:hypothetical protein [Klebsiella pneumoniae]